MLNSIRNSFALLIEQGLTFEEAIASLQPLLKEVITNMESRDKARQYQLIFNLLHWDYSAKNDPIPVHEQDRIELKYSPFDQRTVIAEQIKAAEDWAESLRENNLSPREGLSLCYAEMQMMAHKENSTKEVAKHPSAIAVPQAIVQSYRQFYRAEKRFNPERRNALRPLEVASDVINKSRSEGEELSQEIAGGVKALMCQVHNGTGKGRFVTNGEIENSLIKEFADLVVTILENKFENDKALFLSKQGIGLIKDAVYAVYCLEQDKENLAKKTDPPVDNH